MLRGHNQAQISKADIKTRLFEKGMIISQSHLIPRGFRD